MQPQEPQTPQNNPATPPTPAPEPPVQPMPPSSPSTPPPAPGQPSSPSFARPVSAAPQPVKSGLNKKLVATILGAVLVIATVVAAYFLLFSGVKLSTYTGDQFSFQYPEGYEQKDADEGVIFTEKGDAATSSVVFAYYSAFPEALEQEQVNMLTDSFKEQIQSNFGSIANSDTEVKDSKVEEVQYKGQKALQITGKGVRDGADAGTIKIIAVINTEKIYMIGVGSHKSDPAVAAATDRIIDSFAVK